MTSGIRCRECGSVYTAVSAAMSGDMSLVAEAVGVDAAMRIAVAARAHDGRISVPRTPHTTAVWAQHLSAAEREALARRLGGRILRVSTRVSARSAKEQILELAQEDPPLSNAEIARRLGVGARYVRRVLAWCDG